MARDEERTKRLLRAEHHIAAFLERSRILALLNEEALKAASDKAEADSEGDDVEGSVRRHVAARAKLSLLGTLRAAIESAGAGTDAAEGGRDAGL